MKRSENAKKQVMYSSGEDFYLLCYSILILLDVLECTGESLFKDYRKLPFLIKAISSDKVVYILQHLKGGSLNPVDRNFLFDSYSDGLMKRSEVLKLLFTLEKKGYVTLHRGDKLQVINVSLNKSAVPEGIFDKSRFSSEYKNSRSLKASVKRLKVLTLDTMLEKMYGNNGVKVWAT